MHVGKLPPALPLLTQEFSLRLSQAGVLVATFSISIALSGLILGITVARLGYVRFAVVGVALAGLGSVLGAVSTSASLLLFSRAIEGMGWVVAVVSIPSLMSSLATKADKPIVLGIWGAFVPAGSGFMLLLAPLMQNVGGWQLTWWFCALISLLATVGVALVGVTHKQRFAVLSHQSIKHPTKEIRSVQAWGLFFCFFCYSFLFVSLTSFLPTILIEQSAMSLESASRWTAFVVLANMTGNMSAGRLIRRGIAPFLVISAASLVAGVMALLVFSPLPLAVRITSAFAFAVFSGLVPGSLFATAPRVASQPMATGILVGFMLQAAGLGQWLGPMLLTKLVDTTGLWWHGGLLFLFFGLLGAVSARLGLIHLSKT